jgi:sirohydrochlorin ferrochelatase
MHVLLLVAHGSRRQASNDEIKQLAENLQRIAGDRFDRVVAAFLELAEPDIQAGVQQCVAAGATSITAVPYFLAAGRHVASDIPGELEKAQLKHPDVELRQSGYLGTHQALPQLLMELALNIGGDQPGSEPAQASG